MVLNKINLGLIGLGQMGKTHLHNCLCLKNARLVAVADVSKRSLATMKKTGIRQFTDYDDLLEDSNIDAVIISLPNFLHAEAAIKSAENGKHMFIEKPLARSVSEAERIVSAAKSNGVRLMMGYALRFFPSFMRLKHEIEQGTLGEVQIAVANHIGPGPFFSRDEKSIPKPVPSWWFDEKLVGGGALLDLGCHMIQLLRWYFGETASIQAYLGHRFSMDYEDHSTCILKFKNGTLATLNVGWFARYQKAKIDLFGTAEHAFATSQSSVLFDFANKIFRRNRSSPTYKEIEYFVKCLETDTVPSPSGEDGLEDVRLISTAYNNALQVQEDLGGHG